MDVLAELRRRVDALEAESQIRKLQAAYMEACDSHIGYAIGELFATDGVWEGVGRFASGFGATQGRQAVAEQFEADKQRLPFAAHYLTNEQIWVDGDTARAKFMFLEPAVHERLGAILIAGRYDNEYTRVDGKWYIRHLRCQDIFVASYRDGWNGFPCLETGWSAEAQKDLSSPAANLPTATGDSSTFHSRIYTPAELGKPLGLYQQIARVRATELVLIAGQLSSDQDGKVVGKNDLAKQFVQILANIRAALQSQGLQFSNIIQFRTYLVDARLIEPFMELRQRHFPELFPTGAFPPNTLLIVSRLVREEFLIEIEVTAAC
jgi:enamine deaminase RidA (YjgF/YER057c/UK114 family)